ncbi:MAG: hypothetical protein ABIT38_09810 [Gemmatimonadaceae bacterium]
MKNAWQAMDIPSDTICTVKLAGIVYVRGGLSGFSTQRLIDFLDALGQDVEIIVRTAPRSRKHGRLRVAAEAHHVSARRHDDPPQRR